MLKLTNLHKTFNAGTVNEKKALNGLNFQLDRGDFATIVGSNGAGKSTMFNAITGAFFVEDGTIELDGVDITCTVAPVILFRNVYECDGDWSAETAQPIVDTSDAGASLILAENSRNTVSGAYVAKIYKDAKGEKKLCKQDGAVF